MSVFLLALMLCSALAASDAVANESGFVPYAALTVDTFSNRSGGLATGTSTYGLLDIGFDADLEKLAGWDATTMHIGALWGHGDDPSVDVGDFNALSNIIMPEGGRLFEAFIEKMFANDRGRFKFGMAGMDGDFQVSEYSGYFINSGFGMVPTISGNMPVPIFPQAALSAVLQYSLADTSYVQLGVYDGDAGSDDHGTEIDLDSKQGLAIAAEYGFGSGGEYQASYKFGMVYHTGEFIDLRNGSVVNSNTSLYAVVDQVLVNNTAGEPRLAGFVRLGHSPQAERNVVSSYGEIGINLFGPLAGRTNDVFGLAYLHTDFSDDFINDLLTTGSQANETESVLEIFYQAEISSWLILKPDVQLVRDPLTSSDATVVGLRLEGFY